MTENRVASSCVGCPWFLGSSKPADPPSGPLHLPCTDSPDLLNSPLSHAPHKPTCAFRLTCTMHVTMCVTCTTGCGGAACPSGFYCAASIDSGVGDVCIPLPRNAGQTGGPCLPNNLQVGVDVWNVNIMWHVGRGLLCGTKCWQHKKFVTTSCFSSRCSLAARAASTASEIPGT
jgi:hypothetical protein